MSDEIVKTWQVTVHTGIPIPGDPKSLRPASRPKTTRLLHIEDHPHFISLFPERIQNFRPCEAWIDDRGLVHITPCTITGSITVIDSDGVSFNSIPNVVRQKQDLLDWREIGVGYHGVQLEYAERGMTAPKTLLQIDISHPWFEGTVRDLPEDLPSDCPRNPGIVFESVTQRAFITYHRDKQKDGTGQFVFHQLATPITTEVVLFLDRDWEFAFPGMRMQYKDSLTSMAIYQRIDGGPWKKGPRFDSMN
jgi:hypothetical protein